MVLGRLATNLEKGMNGLVAGQAQPARAMEEHNTTIWVKKVVLAPLVEDLNLKVLD